MSWLFFAIMARFLWGLVNLADHFLVRYVKKNAAAVVIIAESLILIPFILIMLACGVRPPGSLVECLWLLAGSLINTAALAPYYLALKSDHAHNAVPLMELTPVIMTFLAWVLFGDVLDKTQMLGAFLVIGGGFCFAWDFEYGRIKLKTALLMAAASFCFAVYQLILRHGARNESPWTIMLVVSVGYVISAIVMLCFMPQPRKVFFKLLRTNGTRFMSIVAIEEFVAVAANICVVVAFALAPKAGQVAALSATQPIFVLMFTAFLGVLLPRYYPRLRWNREIKAKCLLLLVIASGIILLKAP